MPRVQSSPAESKQTPRTVPPRKRKLPDQSKFYAVRAGHETGVFISWKDCEKNITGFKGANFKSFVTRADAEDYLAGREPAAGSQSATSGTPKFYGIASGRVPGVYTEWTKAQEQIAGWKGPKYKKFATRAEAEEFVRNGGAKSIPVASQAKTKPRPKSKRGVVEEDDSESATLQPAAKRLRKSGLSVEIPPNQLDSEEDQAGEDFDIEGFEDFEDSEVGVVASYAVAKKPQRAVLGNAIRIYTDGSSLSNGKVGARAGVGVFFGHGDGRNVSEPLKGMPQTNQRAELTAILRALEIAPKDREVHIYTDSKYSIECVTVWYKNWELNHWQTALKKPVLNKDLVQAILSLLREREGLGSSTQFNWIKGHANDPGNEAADELAVRGARAR